MALRETVGVSVGERIRNALYYWKMDLREEVREEGREEGREQGREQGKLEGQRELVADQIQARFGEVPTAVADILQQASPEQLSRIGRRVVTAASLEELIQPEDAPKNESDPTK